MGSRLERIAMDKSCSLLGLVVNDEEKKFHNFDGRSKVAPQQPHKRQMGKFHFGKKANFLTSILIKISVKKLNQEPN